MKQREAKAKRTAQEPHSRRNGPTMNRDAREEKQDSAPFFFLRMAVPYLSIRFIIQYIFVTYQISVINICLQIEL